MKCGIYALIRCEYWVIKLALKMIFKSTGILGIAILGACDQRARFNENRRRNTTFNKNKKVFMRKICLENMKPKV